MYFMKKAALVGLLALPLCFDNGAQAQSIQFTVREIALKNGESTEVGDVWWINANCKSILKGTPEVEILDGPPGVIAAINPARVVPRFYSCANLVSGGKLVVTAKEVEDYSYTRMVLESATKPWRAIASAVQISTSRSFRRIETQAARVRAIR